MIGRNATGQVLLQALGRLLSWAPHVDGRAILLASLVVYLGSVAGARLIWGTDLWPRLGVPSGPTLFFDARNLTAAWECDRLGYDPLYESPCDPQRRPLNYLRPWLVLGVLGLDQSHTVPIASMLIGAMFLSFGILVGRVPAGSGIVLSVAACSPAVMLAVERANMDVALFSVVAAAVLVWRAAPAAATILSPALVLLAAVAKVYGVVALLAFFLTRNRTAAWAATCCLAGFSVYAAWNHRDIVHIAQIAPQGVLFSYGARILPAHLYHQFGAERWEAPALLKQMLAAASLAGVTAAAAAWVWRRRPHTVGPMEAGAPSLLALHAGALIYLGTFAAGNNFDYRLVFLLLTLPQLLEWVRTPAHPLSGVAALALMGVLVLLWIGSLSQVLSLWDELASWAVVGLLAALLAATVPRLTFPDGILRSHAQAAHARTARTPPAA